MPDRLALHMPAAEVTPIAKRGYLRRDANLTERAVACPEDKRSLVGSTTAGNGGIGIDRNQFSPRSEHSSTVNIEERAMHWRTKTTGFSSIRPRARLITAGAALVAGLASVPTPT